MTTTSCFINHIKSITAVPADQEEKFKNLVSIKVINEGDEFISAGQFPKTIGFVTKGLFRYYYSNKEGAELTKGFFLENTILSSYSAILQNRFSYFTIQALEDSKLEVVSYKEFSALFAEHFCWNEYLVGLLQKAYMIKEEREREFLLFDAEQRYNAFLLRFPDLEKRVKQQIVASYLGIAPESLSRIRRKFKHLT